MSSATASSLLRSVVLAVFVLVLGTGAAPARAMGALDFDRAEARIASLGGAAIAVLGDPDLDRASRQAALEELLREHFALEQIGRLALGRHWRAADSGERAAYLDLFGRYLLVNYSRLIDFYDDQTLEVLAASETRNAVIVHSRLRGRQSVAIDWRVIEQGGELLIVDVVVEGVSMLVTQRNEFASIIERGGGLKALIGHLEARVGRPAGTAGG